jgi:CMP-N-acetylneuraminic acid synthetase
MSPSVLIVIPARGGSKGVPGKNIRPLGGKPLIAHAVAHTLAVQPDAKVMVSTDSEAIAQAAREAGAEAPFLRPDELSGDAVPAIAPIRHAMEWYDAHGFRAEVVVALHPTSPFLATRFIAEALSRTEIDPGLNSVVGIRRIEHNHPFRAYKLDDDRLLAPLTKYTSEVFLQKQDRPDAYGFVGGLYVRRRALLESWNGQGFALGSRSAGVVIPSELAIDIDSKLDLIVTQAVYEHLQAKGALS